MQNAHSVDAVVQKDTDEDAVNLRGRLQGFDPATGHGVHDRSQAAAATGRSSSNAASGVSLLNAGEGARTAGGSLARAPGQQGPQTSQQNVYIKLAEIDPELAASVGKVREGIKALKKTINDVSLPTHAPDTDTPSKTTASSEQTSEPWASVKRFLLLHQKGGTIKLTREQQAQLVNIWPELTRRAQELQSDLEDVKKKVDKRDLQLAQALADLATTRAEVDTARAANERLQQEGRHMTAAAAARQELEAAVKQLAATFQAEQERAKGLQALLDDVIAKMAAAVADVESKEATIGSQNRQLEEAGSALQSVQTELNDLKTQHTITTQELEKVASRNKELTTQIDGLRGINTQLRTDNDDLRQRAETARGEVDSLNTQLQTAADRNTNLTGQLTTAQASNARLTSDNNALRQVAEGRLQQLRDGAQALAGVQRQLDYLVLNQQPLIYAKAMAERRAAEATNQVTQLASELHQRDEALRQRDEALRQKAEELRQKDSQLEALQWTTGAALQGMRQRMALAEHKADTAALTTIEDERTIRALRLEVTDLTSQLHIAQAAAAHKAAKVEAEQARCAELERCHQETMADKVRLQLEVAALKQQLEAAQGGCKAAGAVALESDQGRDGVTGWLPLFRL